MAAEALQYDEAFLAGLSSFRLLRGDGLKMMASLGLAVLPSNKAPVFAVDSSSAAIDVSAVVGKQQFALDEGKASMLEAFTKLSEYRQFCASGMSLHKQKGS